LESLLEIVLILIPRYIGLISVRALGVHPVSVIVISTGITSIDLALAIALRITVIYGLSQKFITAIVGIVILAVAINPIILAGRWVINCLAVVIAIVVVIPIVAIVAVVPVRRSDIVVVLSLSSRLRFLA
jgi:hypothetical protein